MGCCKSKIDESTGINYGDEENDELPRFDMTPINNNEQAVKARSGNPNTFSESTNFGPGDDVSKSKGGLNDNPRFNQAIEQEGLVEQDRRENAVTSNTNLHNGMKQSPQDYLGGGFANLRAQSEYNKYLYLSIKESKFNQVGKTLEITPKGLTGSTRNSNDGIVYFGLHSLDFKNDFLFKAEEGVNKQHFEIRFKDEPEEGYYVKNLQGSGVFIKIEDYLNLKDGVIISFGTNHLLITIRDEAENQRDNASIINFRAIYGPNKGDEYEFNSVDNSVIRFGRKKSYSSVKIDVAFTEESTSRLQCTISFDENSRLWKIVDSDGCGKKSLNGTWFLADDYIKIESGMLVRVGTTTFEASLETAVNN
mmetsp:Transcript_9465/g.9797  ORF Transcript_9465/g.9797 Transcript_9465/m.9797 type:complete len:364 (+) Transcript_9465:37-1128(+)|eukprot:CAMPEP_0170516304 /NCGR_PEP_ID=MMETSP0209-20121228/2549_1 /TAXON_ID=665100 ORGANISM="Litonotus pictus, Strain P1" /NCGR_SAMPLE_ID=MMETSP0209 /ASSEMBLY_ACC=CAM_ASM_000301 /LENGTH=363 /DNA_ID=CAMNT_0010801127 /DNA_START=1 /DNA_END=1092 /DNA_ORIENTATION=-